MNATVHPPQPLVATITVPSQNVDVKLNKVIGGIYAKLSALEQRIKSLEEVLDRISLVIQQK
jgi:hypothetical protein